MLASRSPEAARDLVAALRDGMVLSAGEAGEIPLEGFTAALLRIDERQGRLGGETALIRKGAKPASQVPPAPSLPAIPQRAIEAKLGAVEAESLAKRVRQAQAGLLAREDCEEERLAIEPEVYALSEKRALLLFSCLMGAYQGSSIGFLAERDSGTAQRLTLPVPYSGNDPGERSVRFFTEGNFDPATATLSMTGRGWGIGDCGTAASWTWRGEDFQLSSLALQQSCGGSQDSGWPVLFRSSE